MRDIPVGNGNLLVNFDDKYQIRDIYFPHVGQENHTEGFPFRFGVWADGLFSWVFTDDWERSLRYLPETLITDVRLLNKKLAIEVNCNDMVAGKENIYLRRIVVKDLSNSPRSIRVFLHHDFRIYENKVGDTAFYDPETLALIHYKKHRYFLINTLPHFDEFATGRKAFHTQEGTWRDAEDGDLHGGSITEGSVDSTLAVSLGLASGETHEFYYWIAAGTNHEEVKTANRNVIENRPAIYFEKNELHWAEWLRKQSADLNSLPESVADLYRRSLLIIRTQIDNGGAIIAANDHDVTDRATDHYSYLWPRDGAFVANALDMAGYKDISRAFFVLCRQIVHERGYFLQKYNPDGTLGSGWHAYWDSRLKRELLPIQEDETALVLWALWEHYSLNPDKEFIKEIYNHLIVKCADFLAAFRDSEMKLPLPSWNLWEDRRGVHTFTCATVVAGLRAAANFADLFGEGDRAEIYITAANEIVDAMREHLYSRKMERFLRSLQVGGEDSLVPDVTVDASLFGIFYFGCFDVNDEMVAGTMKAVEEHLTNKTRFNGIARFENDSYMRVSDTITGNSWFICTLWLAEYYIAKAKTEGDLSRALEMLQWTADRALPSGVLAEQVDPLTGKELSVSPLTWSHSTYVATTLNYIKKLRQLTK
ncbi:MAG: glycoside hydrolase family 15 protein [Pyrinomonadaceae bacterium]